MLRDVQPPFRFRVTEAPGPCRTIGCGRADLGVLDTWVGSADSAHHDRYA
jgi:hypothetical protein